ncbi:aminoacyl tRNA synthase complex-interacting multifunctional protein 1-like [Lingula anatina]|uniref:Aminoacyl tRNA synthase complex-interacting multifunctional protein 1 isoform X1 n=1 Tax=Lingula anatina TaxID=7574 RepID=A0A1S3IQK4_LINAN|nr:aminoacyl tRNA synthase complex-interacting multifunctional protein 1 isoform X1 [Lingula anatina]XP_013400500.1 aminoacyl tRNA synthase complex-interacting multifunctional protein 1-like [Lingula anatina]XP_013400501.1 aminoacyl tRNA synthase complex-interacting multifunctional protein 1-like [Lingula anatina]|eukprot:XP_013390040.1 aminoacyl tRNA synthase complex-interacting multifunctional protein 1 isoform X1 [Lingula anatina]
MAVPTAVLQRVQQRALQAEQIIATLRQQLQGIKQAAVSQAAQKEEVILRAENAKLRLEVEALKQELISAEIRNGVKQMSLPASGTGKTVTSAAPPSQPTPSAAPPVKTEEKKKGKQAADGSAGEGKPPKEGKKKEKKEGKPKQAPASTPEAPIDVSRLNQKIGRIVSVKQHPDADSLYIEEVDVGEEKNRTILSGLVKHVPIEVMQDKLAVFLLNLKPAKMRGVMSEGMIMCASTPEKVEIIDPPPGVVPGDRVTFADYPGEPDAQLNPKKKIWEQIQPDLRVDENGVATYKGCPFKIEGKGICKAPTLRNTPIK